MPGGQWNCIGTFPEVASVGLAEEEAENQDLWCMGTSYESLSAALFLMRSNSRSISASSAKGSCDDKI